MTSRLPDTLAGFRLFSKVLLAGTAGQQCAVHVWLWPHKETAHSAAGTRTKKPDRFRYLL